MTLCNMSIEAGATAALVAPDEVTFTLSRGTPLRAGGRRLARRGLALAPAGERSGGARSIDVVRVDATETLAPLVTWGTRPDMVVPITGAVPNPEQAARRGRTRGDGARARIHGARRRARR